MNKPATLEAMNRRTRRTYRAMGAPTKREIAAHRAAMDAEVARQGRIAMIAAEQQDEMAAARRAKRTGPGAERAAKLAAARRAWMAAN